MTGAANPDPRDADAVESPCTDVCAIDERTGYCEGCGRTLDEIAAWTTYTPAQRRRIVAELGHRLSPPPAT